MEWFTAGWNGFQTSFCFLMKMKESGIMNYESKRLHLVCHLSSKICYVSKLEKEIEK